MKRIYLDYAATTPVDKEVFKAMQPYFSDKFGNPGSIHSFGQEAMAAIDESREKIAKAIGADFREVIFTGSATEANNLALRGTVKAFSAQRLALSQKNLCPRIIISSIEHESILETARDLEKEGIEVIYLPVNKQGFVDLKKLKESLNEQTILVSIMYANNEIGTIQNISEISNIIRNFKNEIFNFQFPISNKLNNSELKIDSKFKIQNSKLIMALPLLHTDAVQAFQFLNCNVNDLGVDLMTLSAHKIYGPKGIGLLYSRISNFQFPISNKLNNSELKIDSKFKIQNSKLVLPIITGGGQEFGLRSGTENVPAIVGFAKAIELAEKNRKKEFKKISELSAYFWKELKKICPKAEINGATINKLPNILNIYFLNQNADPRYAGGFSEASELLMKLDLNGVAVSSGSACSARATKMSHVLKSIDLPENKIKSSLRFSFGKQTTKKEITQAIRALRR